MSILLALSRYKLVAEIAVFGALAGAVIVELLWEIKRIRALALKIDQVQKNITVSGGLELLLESLRADLSREPCVLEDARLRGD